MENNLQKVRKYFGISQEMLALMCRVSQQYISKVEEGIAEPTPTLVEQISLVFNKKIEDIFPRLDEENPLFFTNVEDGIIVRDNAKRAIELKLDKATRIRNKRIEIQRIKAEGLKYRMEKLYEA